MCEHLRSTGCGWSTDACAAAADNGHLDTLRWLRENGCAWDVRDGSTGAARCGYTNILDFVIEQGEVLEAELLTDALLAANTYGQPRAAQWLRGHGAQDPADLSDGEDQL
jgi:hypothetical protein